MNIETSQSWLEFADGRRFDLTGTTTLGRAPDNLCVLYEEEVSRRHALLQAQGEAEYWLVDLGSANGSYVNGRRIFRPQELSDGDVLRLSSAQCVFHSPHAAGGSGSGPGLASTLLSIRSEQCWLMMADIEGSTALAQTVPPEQLPMITGAWFKRCREIIEQCSGHVMKYLGDGFFCFWHDAGGAEGVREAIAHLTAMRAAQPPPFRIVVHYGQAVIGSVPTVHEVNLHGPQVNFTFRIEKIAGQWHLPVMLSEPAASALGLPCRCHGESAVDGFAGSFAFYTPE
jgi:adenylate cyclase